MFKVLYKMTERRVRAICQAMAERAPWLDQYHNGETVTDWEGLEGALSRALYKGERGKARNILGHSYKVNKGESVGISTRILYMAPASLSGINLCPWSTPGCVAGCLKYAGQMNCRTQKIAQLEKSWWFLLYPESFMTRLSYEIERHAKACARAGMVCAVRLNGTSDIKWEDTGIIDAHEEVTFYDYTKAPLSRRMTASNFTLTFSASERVGSVEEAQRYIDRGQNAAIVVGAIGSTNKNDAKRVAKAIVERGTLFGRPVIDGDETDARFLDRKGTFVVLSAKGRGTKDTTGFVHRFAA